MIVRASRCAPTCWRRWLAQSTSMPDGQLAKDLSAGLFCRSFPRCARLWASEIPKARSSSTSCARPVSFHITRCLRSAARATTAATSSASTREIACLGAAKVAALKRLAARRLVRLLQVNIPMATNQSQNEHSIAKTVEPIALGNCLVIGAQHQFAARERAHQHQQRRAWQVEVGYHHIYRPEL